MTDNRENYFLSTGVQCRAQLLRMHSETSSLHGENHPPTPSTLSNQRPASGPGKPRPKVQISLSPWFSTQNEPLDVRFQMRLTLTMGAFYFWRGKKQ